MSALYKSLVLGVWLLAVAITLPMRGPAHGAELTLLSGAHLPFSIPEKEMGIHEDVVRAVLEKKGHQIQTEFAPFINVLPAVKAKQYDVIVPVFVHDLPNDMYASREEFAFQNGAVTLKGVNPVNSLVDFKGQRLIAFRGAKLFLGHEYSNAVSYASSYGETSQYLKQLEALEKGEADISIGDIHLASYAAVQHPFLTSDDLVLNIVFDPLPYHFVFRDEMIRNQFDEGFKELVESGEYQRIISRYIEDN